MQICIRECVDDEVNSSHIRSNQPQLSDIDALLVKLRDQPHSTLHKQK